MHKTKASETLEWYNDNAKEYSSKVHGTTFGVIARDFLKRVGLERPKILEAGCGDGRDAETLTDIGEDVTGIDQSTGLIQIEKERRKDIRYTVGNFLQLPYEDESFDGVWSRASLVHLENSEDVDHAIAEFSRVLRSGGCLYLFVKKQCGDCKTEVVSDTLSNHRRFFRYYTEDELKEVLNKNCFTVDEMVTENDPHGRNEIKWVRVFAYKNGTSKQMPHLC